MPKSRLWKLVNDNFSNVIQSDKIRMLNGKTVAVDANNVIMSNCIAYRNTGADFTNKEGKSTSHIKAILDNATFYLRHNITPFYVFDGKAHSLKDEVIKKRRIEKDKNKAKCADAAKKLECSKTDGSCTNEEDLTNYIKYYKRTFELSRDKIEDIKRVLDYIGVPYIHASGEADPQLAALSLRKDIYGVISEDIDILLFGGTRLIRRKKDKLTIIELKDILSEFSKYFKKKFTRDNFTDIILLLGSEYAGTFKKLSTNTILKYFGQNNFDFLKTVANIKKDGHTVPLKLATQWSEIRSYFLDPVVIDPNSISIQLSKPSKKDFFTFLSDNDFKLETIEKKYRTVETKYKVSIKPKR